MIEKKLLQKFVQKVGEKLSGKWVIIGGSLLPLINIAYRLTEDIDIVGPEKSSQQDTLNLMKIAEELGLPVEAINQAASFFLHRIPYWEQELILLHRGSKGEIYRPTATLFLLLKVQRLSESDLEDCIAMIQFAKEQKEKIHKQAVIKKISAELAHATNFLKTKRLNKLKRLLKELNLP